MSTFWSRRRQLMMMMMLIQFRKYWLLT